MPHLHAPARAAALCLAAAALVAAPPGAKGSEPGTKPAAAAPTARAALLIDTGEEVKRICVRFERSAVSGREVLEAADVDAVLRPFPGQGVAVCSLCGVGCPADGTCLTCGGDRYWGYWRAGPGEASLEFSDVGAASTEVRDGSVEAWRWGTGDAPPGFEAVATVCDDPTSTTVTLTGSSTRESRTGGEAGEGAATPGDGLGVFGVLIAVIAGGIAASRGRRRRAERDGEREG